MADIKETKELLVGVNEMSILIISVLKDGFQAGEDIAKIVEKLTTDAAFREKMMASYEGIQNMPDEVKDISLAEGVELGMIQLSYVPKLLEALKK